LHTRPEQHAAVDAHCAPEAPQRGEPPVPPPPLDVPVVEAPLPKS
jgi:hypothetical protein